jgi:histidinol-phosphate/aromatic aminotransferase/cobyric acid decarboxylase-like protein
MVILVNPNSPTGVYCPKKEMEAMLTQISPLTLVWIDETYIDYVGPNESLEQFACNRNHVIICKSMSKTYALSGVRAAYLCCAALIIEKIQQYAPPWAISLPAQAAAIAALQDSAYYQEKYLETKQLRQSLKIGLEKLGITQIIDGVANFLLFYLPPQTISTSALIEACKTKGLYLRDVSNMGKNIKQNAVRIAVKDRITNQRMLAIIEESIKKAPLF